MDEQRQDDQFEPTYSSSVPIQDVALKTCRKQWTIGRGGERVSGISMLIARHDDDDDRRNWIHLYMSDYNYNNYISTASLLSFFKIAVLLLSIIIIIYLQTVSSIPI